MSRALLHRVPQKRAGHTMPAASALAGGWPLTCFTFPDGSLFLSLGYLPPRPERRSEGSQAGMADVLARVADAYRKDRTELQKRAAALVQSLKAESSPGSGKPGPISFPEPTTAIRIDNKPVFELSVLIQLKLAARRHKDFADVVELISLNKLNSSFARFLHKSLRTTYRELIRRSRGKV